MPIAARRTRRDGQQKIRTLVVGTASAALGFSLLSAPSWAASSPFKAPPVPKTASVDGKDLDSKQARLVRLSQKWQPALATWPQPGTADIALVAPEPGAAQGAAAPAGALPVRIGAANSTSGAKKAPGKAPSKVRVSLADRKAAQQAGVDGLLLSVQRTDSGSDTGAARVEIDYSSIRDAYGAGWSSRLHLVTLPACALTTPSREECRKTTPLASQNNTTSHTLTATAPLQGAPKMSAFAAPSMAATSVATVLGATAGADGSAGSFKATSLSPSGSWSAGGNSGSFGWTVPIAAPQVPGNLVPKISLSYNSSSVDGRTASTNNQPSWIGEGWEYSPGFIERTYASCENDKQGGNNTDKVGDLCWKSDNATLSLNGSSNQLVWDAGKKTWRLANDDGSRVERMYDSPGNNSGDDDSEYWRVTTQDGTQYWFGKNRLPGWSSGKEETNSVFAAPVYGNHPGEPGHADDFATSAVMQGWRWNLDYVVDPHGNAMALYYTKETGYYAQNNKIDTPTKYTRGGYLNRIDYGLRDGAVYSTAGPSGRVTFDTAERCLASDCTTFDKDHATNWPDTPVDLNCTDGKQCLQGSPTFWARKRLTAINTYALAGTTLQPVDTWTLTQSFPKTGDVSSPSLWLDSIQRTAKAGDLPDIQLPATTFSGDMMPNRVDAAEGRPPLNKQRLTKVTNETGGQTLVSYSPIDCTPTSLPTPDNNGRRCYPSWWTPTGAIDPVKDWFHKYVVTQVIDSDTTGGSGSGSKTTSYAYADGPNWAKDTGEFTIDKHRTWRDFHGYGTVRTYVGQTNRTKSETSYFVGMAGDTLADGSARPVAKINGVTDRPDFSGRTAETRTYDKDDALTGNVVAKTTYTPWESAPTATQAVKGITDPDTPTTPASTLPDEAAHYSGTVTETKSTLLDDGKTWRTLTTNRSYDPIYGLLAREGDDGANGSVEAKCTTTDYAAPDTAKWLIAYPSQITNFRSRCEDSTLNGWITSASRTSYDGQTVGAAPKAGQANATKTEQASSLGSDGNLVWETTAQTTYDASGRVRTAKGQDGQTTTTDYTPADGAQPTKVAVTDPKGFVTTATLDGLRGLTLTTADANNRITTTEYDAAGRLVRAWNKGRATSLPPNATFAYALSSTSPSSITAKKLYEDGTWGTTTTIYDSLLHQRQTQSDAIGAVGRVVADTFYDDHGRGYRNNAQYYNSQPVSGTLLVVADNQVPSATLTEYDGRSRPTSVATLALNNEKWRTTTSYGATWTATVPPEGGTATLVITDARGRTIEQRQYKDRNPVVDAPRSQYETTTRAYDQAGQLAKVTDSAARNSWSYGYDLRGRQVLTTDPDKGASTTTYGADGRAQTTTDARGTTLATTYDELGRKASLRKDSITGTKLAEWTYDTAAGGKGLPATSVRYDTSVAPSAAYTTAVSGYDSVGRPANATVSVPAVPGEEKLAGTYGITLTSTPVNGLPLTAAYSTSNSNATTALPAETVSNHYVVQDQLGMVDGTLSQSYLRGAAYTPFGELAQAQLGNKGARVIQTLTHDALTHRLTNEVVDREASAPQTLSNIGYTYDPAGNVTRIRDDQNDGTVADDQCFIYDWAKRLTEAWTTGDACTTKPANGSGNPALGSVDPYWTSWTFTDTDQRATETQHKAGPVTADTTRTYSYPSTSGAAQPHGVRSITANGGTTGTDNYAYDQTGNLTKKTPATGSTQDMKWNEEGKLASSSTAGATTSFLYDAEGTRILKREPAATTLYLPGGQELTLAKATGILAGTRYYTVPGGSAVRTSSDSKVRILIADSHGTNQLSISASNLAVNRRKTLPYGALRGTAPTFWPGQKGFVGGDIDSTTNLTHIGARDYDASLGQFISIDPVFTIDDPQSLNGYAYANNSPVTSSDPTGLCIPGSDGRCEPGMDTRGSGRPGHDPDLTEGDSGSGDSGEPVVRNGGKSNVASECSDSSMAGMSAHDASVCQSGFAAQEWAVRNNVPGYVTVDLGVRVNDIPGASGNNTGNDGRADVIFWSNDRVYIWEVKPNTTPYGRVEGPIDLNRYVTKLQRYFNSVGDHRDVLPGPSIASKTFSSKQGTGRVWSEDPEPGMRYYGTDNKRTRSPQPTPNPSAGPTSVPRPKSTTSPQPEPSPSATGMYGDPDSSADSAYSPVGAGLAGVGVGGAVVRFFSGIGEIFGGGPACVIGGMC
ncbi:RHS repeat domain-containing protein [Streptomyces violascens]|uniref:RHS repeat domain-containing protein n=1 Tax=Streptomyces violascens TaxID=67381 RepID=UPI00368CE9C5